MAKSRVDQVSDLLLKGYDYDQIAKKLKLTKSQLRVALKGIEKKAEKERETRKKPQRRTQPRVIGSVDATTGETTITDPLEQGVVRQMQQTIASPLPASFVIITEMGAVQVPAGMTAEVTQGEIRLRW